MLAEKTTGWHEEAAALGPPEEPAAFALDGDSLIEGLKNGNEEAYEALIGRYQQPIYNLVYRLVGDPVETSDIVQEVFFKIFRHIGWFRGQSSLKTWIYRIAVNEAHNYRRWFGRRRRNEVGLEVEVGNSGRAHMDSLPDPGKSPHDIVAGRQQRVMIEEALSKLKPVFRQAVVLRDIEDLSYEEIAEVLEVSLGTVKSRILRGREALRCVLQDRLESAKAIAWAPHPVGQD